MQIFIDSANPNEVEKAYKTGMVDGVTTNPTLAAKAGIDYKTAVNQILKMVDGPVSLEVLSTEAEEMVQEGRKLKVLGENVVVKIPMGVEGVKATRILKSEGIKVNMTLVFSTSQALLAAKAGADYVSPFVGRGDDAGFDGMELVAEISEMLDVQGYVDTSIIASSIRGPLHVEQSAMLGADIATIPPEVFWKLFAHPMTDAGLEKFLKDFEDAGVTPLV